MPKPTIDDIRAMIDPQGYLRAMGEVLENYKGNLARSLADHDVMAVDDTLSPEARATATKRMLAAMQTIVGRIEMLEAKIAAVKDGPPPSRAERRRESKKTVDGE